MHTKEKVEKFFVDLHSLGLKKPVAAIALKTGIGKSTVSQYLNRKKEPSENFIQKFYEKFDDELKKIVGEDGLSASSLKKTHAVSLDMLSGVILRTYALQQVSLSVLSELLAEKTGASVTVTQSELLKAVEAEEVKMRDALRELK